MIHLVIGGARSGKSSFAEQQVLAIAKAKSVAPSYIATATAGDNEMQQRISHHQKQRQTNNWLLHECPLALTSLLAELDSKEQHQNCYLLDCLTLWLTNVLMDALEHSGDPNSKEDYEFIDQKLYQAASDLVQALSEFPSDIVIVTNEVGQGIVPLGQQSRLFVDHAGWLNQAIARIADKVTLVTAGLPLELKSCHD